MPLQVGITGGIGAGKSLVSKIFRCLGIPVYDADSRAKYLMTTDGILLSEIKKEFGELSVNPDGSLNRAYLSKAVFSDPGRLSVLNSLVHPRVAVDYKQWAGEQQGYPYLLKEAALLYESGSADSLDFVIVVSAPEPLRIKRVLQRDVHRSENQVKNIIARQMADEAKLRRADAIITNDESTLVIPQVIKIHEKLKYLEEKRLR